MAHRGKAGQRGFTLLETLAVLAIGAMVIAGLLAMVNTTYSNTRAQQAALYQSQLAGAAAQLIKANYTTLLSANMTATTPIVVSMTGSTPAGFALGSFLPASMQGGTVAARNAYQQTPCLLIYRGSGTGWTGGTGPRDIEAFLVTEGGQTVDDRTLGYIEANGGSGGGAFQSIAGGAAQGAFGNWYAPMSTVNPAGASCTGVRTGVGHLVSQVYYSGGNGTSGDFLYRQPTSVTGVADGNTMHAPIFLDDQTHTDRTSDTDCGSGVGAGKITADPDGNILNCNGTEWQLQGSMHWRTTVDTWADLASLNPEVGDVVLTTDTSRTFAWTGSAWQALAVDQKGNLSVPGWIDLGNTQTEGTACTPDSASATMVATGSSGQVLSCQNGLWEPHELEYFGTGPACFYILPPTAGATDYPGCSSPSTWPSSDAVAVKYFISFSLSKPYVISVSSWAHMDDGVCGSTPGNQAQVFQSIDIYQSGNTTSLYHQEAQSPTLTDDAASINNTISQPVGAGSYTVQISTSWSTYGPSGFGTPWTSSHCVNGTTVPTSPLVIGYAISSYD